MSKNKHSLEDYQRAGVELYEKLHIDTFPVAAKYIKSLDEIPKGVIRPIDTGQKMSVCQAMTQARRWGHKLCITADDNFCTPSTAGFGWIHGITAEEMIESQVRQRWRKDEDSEKRRQVDQTSVRQLQNFVGFGESCQKGAYKPYLYNRPEFVLPGTGDRSFCGIQDWEVGMGLPAEAVFYVLENLFATGRGQGLKFPLRQVIPRLHEKITPGFIFMREIIDKTLKKEKESS